VHHKICGGEGLADAECGGFTCWTVEGRADQEEEEDTIVGLRKKYPWWTLKAPVEGAGSR
jgi:hypothetical protein